ncbi:MAG: hypothetical protein GF375_00245 [Candidatus Omnitrophica bacterium]|nr:hypothetical protein [Candidatus Omnitrophota bacterium]
MVTKIFRILSNSDEFLSAEVVGEALLKHVTLAGGNPKAYFAVAERSEEPVNQAIEQK